MIEYNIKNPSIERSIKQESSTVERVRPDDTFKWNDDEIFLPVKSKPMKGLERNWKTEGFCGKMWKFKRKEEEGSDWFRNPSLDEIILGLC